MSSNDWLKGDSSGGKTAARPDVLPFKAKIAGELFNKARANFARFVLSLGIVLSPGREAAP